MAAVRETPAAESFGFGFDPAESTHHFLVTIPAGTRRDVLISEHYTWDAKHSSDTITFASGVDDGKLRAALDRQKWNAIADEVRVEFNRSLKKQGLASGAWKASRQPAGAPARQGTDVARLGDRRRRPDAEAGFAGSLTRSVLFAVHSAAENAGSARGFALATRRSEAELLG